MESIAPPATVQDQPWKISGGIAPAPLGPLYQLGATLNALAMLLLPGLYLAMVGGIGWLVYQHATEDTGMLEGTGNSRDQVFGYIVPIVVGSIAVVFLIKPLFARRAKQPPALEITREQQPRLFAFIDEICALVRAPRPRRVVLDMQVNASAGFSRKFGSLLRRDLTLTIGLPLTAGLSMREFGGVLAHEFGHFAQGAGMRLTYVICSLNAWFARLVYERDSWDDFLRAASSRIDIRIGIIFYLARAMVWLTRKILWVFMWVGHGLSCFMLRQMEFDADHYETQIAGSDAFATTSQVIRVIGVARQRAMSLQQESFSSGRLVDDLPGLIKLETQRVTEDVRKAMNEAAGKSKTGWFDTHPSDSDRLQAAERAKAVGVLKGEGAATEIFENFTLVAQQVTAAYYEHDCGIDLKKVKMLPLSAVEGEAKALGATEKAARNFFQGLLTIRTLLVLSPGELHRVPSRDELDTQWRSAFERRAEALPETEKLIEELLDADSVDLRAEQARTLSQAGFKLNAKEFGLPEQSAQAVIFVQNNREKMTARCASLKPVLAAARERFVAALQIYFLEPSPEGVGGSEREEIERLVRIISRMDNLAGNIISLRNSVASFELLLHNSPKEASTPFFNTIRGTGASMIRDTTKITEAMADLEYPFEHARGTLLLSDFLVESSRHGDQSVYAFLRGQVLIERLFTLYYRIMGRLAELALQAEQTTWNAPVPAASERVELSV